MVQELLVLVLVFAAAAFAFWSLAGARLRLAALRSLLHVLPVLRSPLGRLEQRLQAPAGCSACKSRSQ
jgi:hypothetical protein